MGLTETNVIEYKCTDCGKTFTGRNLSEKDRANLKRKARKHASTPFQYENWGGVVLTEPRSPSTYVVFRFMQIPLEDHSYQHWRVRFSYEDNKIIELSEDLISGKEINSRLSNGTYSPTTTEELATFEKDLVEHARSGPADEIAPIYVASNGFRAKPREVPEEQRF